MGSLTAPLDLNLDVLERSKSMSLGFFGLYPVKEHSLMLLLNINRKSYMGSPMAASRLTLSDHEGLKSSNLKGQSQLHSGFKVLYLENEPS